MLPLFPVGSISTGTLNLGNLSAQRHLDLGGDIGGVRLAQNFTRPPQTPSNVNHLKTKHLYISIVIVITIYTQ